MEFSESGGASVPHPFVGIPKYVDPLAAVVVGDGDAVDVRIHEPLQPLLRRQLAVNAALPMPMGVVGARRVRVKVEFPPACSRIGPLATVIVVHDRGSPGSVVVAPRNRHEDQGKARSSSLAKANFIQMRIQGDGHSPFSGELPSRGLRCNIEIEAPRESADRATAGRGRGRSHDRMVYRAKERRADRVEVPWVYG